MIEPHSDQPHAVASQPPQEDPGAWSLGAAALIFLLFFGAQLVGAVAVAAVVILLAGPGAALGRMQDPSTFGGTVGVFTFASYALFLALGYLIWIRPRQRLLRQALALLPSRFRLWIAIPVALATGVFLDAVLLLFKQSAPPIMHALLSSPLSIALFGLAAITIVPLTEEIYFRGVLWGAVRRRAGLPAAVLITSAVFGLAHASIYGAMLAPLLSAFAMGLVLAWIRERAASVVPCILAHAVLNLYAITTFVAFSG